MTTAMATGLIAMSMIVSIILPGCDFAEDPAKNVIPATGKPAEGELASFLGEPLFQKQLLFEGGERVREPYLAVAADGTVLALRNGERHLRRSEDGGQTWEEIMEVPFGFMDSNMIVDENTGDILSVRIWDDGSDRLWRSRDHGKTWDEEMITLKPNEVMKWLEQTGLKKRTSRQDNIPGSGTYYIHANASEAGITLRHGENRDPVDAVYSCAIYSDYGGATWQVSGFFPEGYTEEAALVELHDGRLYYNSRSHRGYYDTSLEQELPEESALRREAWSRDGGATWKNLNINQVLTDGGGYDRGYGMKGGLVRLPVKDRDILIFSNADTGGGAREKMTVWASFDGGQSWPVKHLVNEGPSAYSSLAAGRPGTPGQGQIYLLFEGVEAHHYHGMQIARFNLSWLLEGDLTGDGRIPAWINR